MKIVIDEFSHSIVANYFLKLTNDKIYLLYKNDLYCFNGILWEKLNNELHDRLEELIEHFRHYNYLIKFIKQEIQKL